MPPKMYHVVSRVRCPRKAPLKLSAKDLDAEKPRTRRRTPSPRRIAPMLRVALTAGLIGL